MMYAKTLAKIKPTTLNHDTKNSSITVCDGRDSGQKKQEISRTAGRQLEPPSLAPRRWTHCLRRAAHLPSPRRAPALAAPRTCGRVLVVPHARPHRATRPARRPLSSRCALSGAPSSCRTPARAAPRARPRCATHPWAPSRPANARTAWHLRRVAHPSSECAPHTCDLPSSRGTPDLVATARAYMPTVALLPAHWEEKRRSG